MTESGSSGFWDDPFKVLPAPLDEEVWGDGRGSRYRPSMDPDTGLG